MLGLGWLQRTKTDQTSRHTRQSEIHLPIPDQQQPCQPGGLDESAFHLLH
jgi:hypothetical protein